MAQVQELKVEARTGTGKGPAYQARQKGLIPAVVYGGKAEPENVNIDGHALFLKISAGHFLTTLLTLDIAGRKTRVIPRDVQIDPVTDFPVHVDFMRLGEGATIRLAIPVRFRGQETSPGLKKGGVLNIVRHEIGLICPAETIPNTVDVDVSGLDINESIHIASLNLPEGVKPVIRDRNFTICSVVAPTSVREELRAAATAAEAPAAEAAAPAAAAAAPAAAPAKK
jgi:large subunit ribosomal protein L25